MGSSTQNFTKAQLINVLRNWGFTDKLPPKKGEQLIITWPAPADPNIATITVASYKSTYNQTLYMVVFDKK